MPSARSASRGVLRCGFMAQAYGHLAAARRPDRNSLREFNAPCATLRLMRPGSAWQGYAWSVAAASVCTLAGLAMRGRFDLANIAMVYVCLLYTSDAADERSSVDL